MQARSLIPRSPLQRRKRPPDLQYNLFRPRHALPIIHLHPLQPGTVPNRQNAPHPHEALLDPTQQYVLSLDLGADVGADLVRVYAIDQTMNLLIAKTLLKTKAGSRPRYAAFSLDPIAGQYIFYLGAKIGSTITALSGHVRECYW